MRVCLLGPGLAVPVIRPEASILTVRRSLEGRCEASSAGPCVDRVDGHAHAMQSTQDATRQAAPT